MMSENFALRKQIETLKSLIADLEASGLSAVVASSPIRVPGAPGAWVDVRIQCGCNRNEIRMILPKTDNPIFVECKECGKMHDIKQ